MRTRARAALRPLVPKPSTMTWSFIRFLQRARRNSLRDCSVSARRVVPTSSTTNSSASCTRCACKDGAALMMLSTPEDTDTATVLT